MPKPYKEPKDMTVDEIAKLTPIYQKADGSFDSEEFCHARDTIQQINDDLVVRETNSDIFNGIPYSDAYDYNRRKAINYSPPRNPEDDREVSTGIVHEKIVSFCASFLKYVWKRRVRAYDQHGRLIPGLGDAMDLAIEHSYRLEKFIYLWLLIFWEVFTQGNAWVLEDWQVRLVPHKKAYKLNDKGERVEVTADNMDYTLEFLEGLTYEETKATQERMARSVVLDGRNVILGNPELERLQDQPRVTIEMEMSNELAKQLFGSLKRFASVPDDYNAINLVTGDTTTLFNAKRLKKPKETKIAHITFDKYNNRYNVFLNGVMMLPRHTTMEIFYPRMNYPLTNVAGERLKGSAYARSIPAKTKFNADYLDWILKVLADKFEQGAYPAILSHGKYTLSRKMFRGGQVTHGVAKTDYEKADPENKGITQSEFSFAEMFKQTLEAQTANPTSSGQLEQGATATAIGLTEKNQQEKLGYMLDGMTIGFMDMAERRIETIESKYTLKSRETLVDGHKVNVYQNFTVSAYGSENHVIMDDTVGTEGYDDQKAGDQLFEKSFDDSKKKGMSTKYFLVNPVFIRERKCTYDVEILPDQRKNTNLQMIMMWDEFDKLIKTFGPRVDIDKLKEEYLEVSGRPQDIFNSKDAEQLEKEVAAQDTAAGGTPPGMPPAAPAPIAPPKSTPQMLNQPK